jgi:ribosome-binding protein aMBF1 (putative translation factor)
MRAPQAPAAYARGRGKIKELKFQLRETIVAEQKKLGLSYEQMAERVGTFPSAIKAIDMGRVDKLPLDRIARFVCHLGYDVEICVTERKPTNG